MPSAPLQDAGEQVLETGVEATDEPVVETVLDQDEMTGADIVVADAVLEEIEPPEFESVEAQPESQPDEAAEALPAGELAWAEETDLVETLQEDAVVGDDVLPELKDGLEDDAALRSTAQAESVDEEAVDEPPLESSLDMGDTDVLFWREEPEQMQPLALGAVVNGRYQISQVLSVASDQVMYRVRDLQRCPQCGFTDNNPDQAFCDSCGAMLDQKTMAMMLEHPAERSDAPADIVVSDHFQEVDRCYWVWRETSPAEPVSDVAPSMVLEVAHKTDVGRKRELDEDSVFVLVMSSAYAAEPDQLALFIVADGMGGHEGGEVASKLAIQTCVNELVSTVLTPKLADHFIADQEIQARMVKAVQKANEQVFLERQKRNTDMGTTMTVALLSDWSLFLAHVGDCRAYIWGVKGLRQLTTDHSIIASMIASGNAEPEEIYTHPQRSVIYRSIGDRPSVEVDSSIVALDAGERLIMCSDGLWEMIRNEGIDEVLMREADSQRACEVMVDLANAAGGVDNITVIIAQV